MINIGGLRIQDDIIIFLTIICSNWEVVLVSVVGYGCFYTQVVGGGEFFTVIELLVYENFSDIAITEAQRNRKELLL